MKGGRFLFVFLVLLIILLLIIYFFVPLNTIEFSPKGFSQNSTMSGSFGNSSLQFYDNMRYKDKQISYKIYDACPLQRKNDMQDAFNIISNLTVLTFYPVVYGEEISVTCSNDNIIEGNAFVGGEGGVTNVTIAGDFNVIFNGKVLLLRDSKCPTPNIAIHELLHALGFDHSKNPGNIMYDTSSCSQTIGKEIPDFINSIYSVPSEPDVVFENVSAVMHGKYLDANISIRNKGLDFAPSSKLIIYADDKQVKDVEVSSLGIGYGRKISFTNLWVNKINVDKITFALETDFTELSKANNVYTLSVKK